MPRRLIRFLRPPIEYGIPILVLLTLFAYTYAYLFRSPYPGFSFNPGTGIVDVIFVPHQSGSLLTGDRLIKVDQIWITDFQQNKHTRLLANVQKGDLVPLIIERNGKQVQVEWVYPGRNPGEFQSRLFEVWWLGYIFFGFGTATLLFVRPKNSRWRLMIAFNYLTALWIVIGISSIWATWESAILFRVFLWLAVPINVMLHWEFPIGLGKIPPLGSIGYHGFGILFALLQWFSLIPASLVYIAFAISVLASATLLLLQFLRYPGQRRTVVMVSIAAAFALLPAGILSLIRFTGSAYFVSTYSIAAFPILPAFYFFSVYRRHLGEFELRANRLISVYVFLIGMGTLELVLLGVLLPAFGTTIPLLLFSLGIPVLVVLIYPSFGRWMERHVLSIPVPPANLLENYAARITSSLGADTLEQFLSEEILPSLMVRQSALFYYDDLGKPYVLHQIGLKPGFSLNDDQLAMVWAKAGKYIPHQNIDNNGEPISWVRLALPLMIGNNRVGIWLFGRRDPDDFYSQGEIPTLQVLANQTAISLLYHAQSQRLSQLYQDDIARKEAERLQLALELHDGVLNQLAILSLADDQRSPAFEQAYNQATTHIREIISGLRPTMLNYGLRPALDELADEAPAQVGGDMEIQVELPASDVRYSPTDELHLYRIIQEACKNALKHSRARFIRITGLLEQDCIDIRISDDGVGMPDYHHLDLDSLLTHKHFGLAGMVERAQLIGAQIEISSSPGQGTRVRVHRP